MPRDVDFEVRITTSDHFAPERRKDPDGPGRGCAGQRGRDGIGALFSCFPRLFRLRIFAGEEEACAWLLEQREEILRSGSGAVDSDPACTRERPERVLRPFRVPVLVSISSL